MKDKTITFDCSGVYISQIVNVQVSMWADKIIQAIKHNIKLKNTIIFERESNLKKRQI